jgi:simple sugar transport system permease protein
VNQTIALPPQAQLPSLAALYNQTLGNFLPKLDLFALFSYTVDVSIFLALIAVVIYWFIVSRTTFGYEIRVIGQNPKAAQYAGIPSKRNIFLVMVIAGAFGGLAGSTHLMGQPGYELSATAFSLDPTGFDAIAVALLGRTTAIGVLLAALLFGGMRSGSTAMQAVAHVDPNLVLILEALVLFFIAAEFLPVVQRAMPNWLGGSRKPVLVPATAGGLTSAELSENDNKSVKQDRVEVSDLDKEE